MPTPAQYRSSVAISIRTHFGLTQAELGRWLAVTAAAVGHVEAGRGNFGLAAERRLRALSWLLPPEAGGLGPPVPPALLGPPPPLLLPAEAEAPAAPALAPLPPVLAADLAATPAPDLAEVRERLRRVRHLAAGLRYDAHDYARRRHQRARRQWGLGVLAALLAPPPGVAPTPAAVLQDAAFAPATDAQWLARLLAEDAAAPLPLSPAAYVLLVARLRGLDAEAAALEAALAAA